MRYIFILTLSLVLGMPFILPRMMNSAIGYGYGWIPGYSVALAEYLKRRGISKLSLAMTMQPSGERDLLYNDARSSLLGAKSIYHLHSMVLPFVDYFEEQMIMCGKMTLTVGKSKSL